MNNKNRDDDNTSISQLEKCARMLAVSVVQHRGEHKPVALADALPFVVKDGKEDNDENTIIESNKLYKEALAMVKTGSVPVTEPEVLKEQRSQPRINVSSSIKIKVPSSGYEYQGNLVNISWGGIRVLTKELLGDMNDTVEISLPSYDGRDIHIVASIVRTWKSEDMYHTAIRFSRLRHKDESRLHNLLKLLLDAEDDEHRRDTRFAQRIDVSYWDPDELKATLKDISMGGMTITMPEPVELNKSIQLQLEGTDGGYSIILRARVVRLETVNVSDYELYQVALKFEHPTEELRSMINTLMHSMMNKGQL
jgi:c-di-GMP-binding flagellar brake protein YcgR